MTPYQIEQLECLQTVREYFTRLPDDELEELKARTADYLSFRRTVQSFLFDELEQLFIDAGYRSPLMYLHNGPGLLRVKERAGTKIG
jgi:hypothetical protein